MSPKAGVPPRRFAEGEARYRQLIEQATDIIYNCDLEGRFTFVNPTATRLMKYTEQELLGRHFVALIRKDYREPRAEFYSRQRSRADPAHIFRVSCSGEGWQRDLARTERSDYRGRRYAGRRAGHRARYHRAARARAPAAAGAEDGRRSAGWPAAWRTISTTC